MISARQMRKSASVRRSMPKICAILLAARDAKSLDAAGASIEGERVENMICSARWSHCSVNIARTKRRGKAAIKNVDFGAGRQRYRFMSMCHRSRLFSVLPPGTRPTLWMGRRRSAPLKARPNPGAGAGRISDRSAASLTLRRSMHCRIALQRFPDLSSTTNKIICVSMSYGIGILAAFQTPTDCGRSFSASHEGWGVRGARGIHYLFKTPVRAEVK